ncbi:HNH endonuclease [Lacinutrix venerupis]|uniref:HNH endonuclease n=1 Tax=Lacinutrix venerupis TaxID=1486034 RepID=UPI000EB15353|nr:HNH endonuclease [Lacinutrix venerupis]RLJ62582.1 HNH endonuclease [Lacinutrix venerupis]
MSCKRGKASPNPFTKTKLFANSGGFCQNPDCNENLFKTFEEKEIHIAEIAHIISVNKGARKNSKLTPEEKGSYENLILLCPNCHTTIDKAEDDFPTELILKWKSEHKNKLNNVFGIKKYKNRNEARKHIEPILLENRMIFETYGPNTDERYNPESTMPVLWLKKIREFIIPNNRKILNIIDSNYDLLNSDEKIVFESFKHHLHDFESKHIYNEESNGIQFPIKITETYV